MSEDSNLQHFKLIAGISGDEDDDKVLQLLSFHNNDLNNAISVYFDSKFESLHEPPPTPPSTAFDSNDISRAPSTINDSRQFANLHQQMFLDNFIPKLPKAPKTTNHWQLELGIHLSLLEKKEESEVPDSEPLTESPVSSSPNSSSPARTLWILLLIIPNKLFQFIFSAIKYLLGYNLYGSKAVSTNTFPLKFDYDMYNPASIIPWVSKLTNTDEEDPLEKELSEKEPSEKVLSEKELSKNVSKKNPSKKDVSEKDNSLPYNIYDSNFNDIHSRTQKEYVWLLVVLVNNSSSSSAFVQQLFTHPSFSKLFNSSTGTYKDTLIYMNNVETDPESFEVAQTYNVKKLPYIMLVGNVSPNPQQTLNSMSILYKSNLSISKESASVVSRKVLYMLNKLLNQFNPQLITWKLDQQEIEFARAIKQQQDDAYQESLLRDQIKKSQKHSEQLKKYFLFTLLELDYSNSLLGSDIRLAIKLPHGSRIVEKFGSSITANDLYLYVELKLLSHEHENEDMKDLLDDIELPENIKLAHDITPENYYLRYPCKHELIQPFPKSIVPNSETVITEVPELKSGANLLVEFKEEDEDEDEDVDVEENETNEHY